MVYISLCLFFENALEHTCLCTSRPPGSPTLQEAGWTVQAPPSWTTVGRRLAKEQGPWDGVLSSLLDILCVTGAQRRILARNVLLASLMVFSEGQGMGPAGLKFSEQPDLLRIGKWVIAFPVRPLLPSLVLVYNNFAVSPLFSPQICPQISLGSCNCRGKRKGT